MRLHDLKFQIPNSDSLGVKFFRSILCKRIKLNFKFSKFPWSIKNVFQSFWPYSEEPFLIRIRVSLSYAAYHAAYDMKKNARGSEWASSILNNLKSYHSKIDLQIFIIDYDLRLIIYRACDRLRCTSCDFHITIFDDQSWREETDYLFLRNNHPDRNKLKRNLEWRSNRFEAYYITQSYKN